MAAARAYHAEHATLAAPRTATALDKPVGQWLSNLRRPGARGDHPERDKARSIVAASTGIASAVAVGRRYADQAATAAARCPSAQLAEGFERLAYSLLDGLPTA